MAGEKISALASVAGVFEGDVFPVIQGGVNRKATLKNVLDFVLGTGKFQEKASAINIGNISEQHVAEADHSTEADHAATAGVAAVATDAEALGGVLAQQILDALNAARIPAGTVAHFAGPVPPNGWLERDGSQVSRITYADLFAVIGTTYGPGDGVTTFNLPDARGGFDRGWDTGGAIDPGRALGSTQEDAMQKITGSFGADERTAETIQPTGAFAKGDAADVGSGGDGMGHVFTFDSSRVVRTADETRPYNTAYLAIIKY